MGGGPRSNARSFTAAEGTPAPWAPVAPARRRCREPTASQPRALVGVGVVLVVLDAPGLKRVEQGEEHDRAHHVLQHPVLAKHAVPGIVPDDKPLRVWDGGTRG